MSVVSGTRGGVDLGGTKIQTVVVDDSSRVLGESRRATPTEGGPEAICAEIAGTLRDAAAAAQVGTEDLAGVGVGSPGDADEATGVVSGARNLSGWHGSFPLGARLAERLGTEVRVGNDVQVAVDGEFRLGAGERFETLIGVWWGTGVGGGLVLDGRPWLGRGAAAELGHMVVRRGGPRCSAGHSGCVEAYAGRASMERRARKKVASGETTRLFEIMTERGRDRLTSGIWERALEHGDELAGRLLARAEKALGIGIASAVNLLDPEAVILGGGMGSRFAERSLPRIERHMSEYLFAPDDPPALRAASLGDLGGAIGATLLIGR